MPGDTGHPKVQAGIDALLAACESNGKAAACLAGDVTTGIAWARRGFRMISVGYDIGLLTNALASGIRDITDALEPGGTDAAG